ncbi:MAG: hypothetical protein AB8I08_09815 [Sandaracinaceae bacterium]
MRPMLLAVVLLSGWATAPCHAQSSADLSPARVAYEAGIAALEEGLPEQALAQFEEAQSVEPAIRHALALAATLQELRRPTEAIDWYDRLLDGSLGELDPAQREAIVEARRSAHELQGSLHVETQSPEPLLVELDGTRLGTARVGSPIQTRLDAGVHRIRVAGRRDQQVSVRVGETARVSVASPMRVLEQESPSVVPWVVLSLSAVPLAVGIGTTIPFQDALDQANRAPDHETALPHVQSAEPLGIAATVSFIASGAMGLLGLVWGLVDLAISGSS